LRLRLLPCREILRLPRISIRRLLLLILPLELLQDILLKVDTPDLLSLLLLMVDIPELSPVTDSHLKDTLVLQDMDNLLRDTLDSNPDTLALPEDTLVPLNTDSPLPMEVNPDTQVPSPVMDNLPMVDSPVTPDRLHTVNLNMDNLKADTQASSPDTLPPTKDKGTTQEWAVDNPLTASQPTDSPSSNSLSKSTATAMLVIR